MPLAPPDIIGINCGEQEVERLMAAEPRVEYKK